jgi:hypothetical protein
MDGNTFSGRFAAFVGSNSAVVKMGIVREALLGDWIRPWVHYIPISLHGVEWAEVVRYLVGGSKHAANGEGGDEGNEAARKIAQDGADWAARSLRRADLETWMFRLLLEYGRLIDDSRNEIGYAGG